MLSPEVAGAGNDGNIRDADRQAPRYDDQGRYEEGEVEQQLGATANDPVREEGEERPQAVVLVQLALGTVSGAGY